MPASFSLRLIYGLLWGFLGTSLDCTLPHVSFDSTKFHMFFFVSVITLSPLLSLFIVYYTFFSLWLLLFQGLALFLFLNVGIHLIGLFYLKEGRWFCDFKGFCESGG